MSIVLPNLDAGRARFRRLAAEWKKGTFLSSKIKDKVLHPAYQKIIGMGPSAVTFILRDLLDNGPNHWFWALHAITEENPVPADQVGDIVAMTEAWLQWGRKNGCLEDSPKGTGKRSRR
jgi:hypothetical protein